MILKNAIQTPDGTILQSYHRHDSKNHIDSVTGHVYGVDGGSMYLKRFGPPGYKELSVLDDGNHETRRNNVSWGNNYDKHNNRLPDTKWILIKDLTNSHLKAIAKYLTEIGVVSEDSLHYQIILDEIKYRQANKPKITSKASSRNTVTSGNSR